MSPWQECYDLTCDPHASCHLLRLLWVCVWGVLCDATGIKKEIKRTRHSTWMWAYARGSTTDFGGHVHLGGRKKMQKLSFL